MSTSAHVLSVQALEELRAALVRFGGEAQQSLSAAAQEIRRTFEWLAERRQHWQGEVRRWQEAVHQAQAALARCKASGYYDRDGHYHAPDCSKYEVALLQMQVRLAEAEDGLRSILNWTQMIEQEAAEYQRQAQGLAGVLGESLPGATAFLGRASDTLRSYVSMTAPSSGVLPSGLGFGDSYPPAGGAASVEHPQGQTPLPEPVVTTGTPGVHPEAPRRVESDRALESVEPRPGGVEGE